MTTEERLDRIQHITAGLAEERRRDREEYRQSWRETQRQRNELTIKISEGEDAITRLAEESRAADKRLENRIETLISAIGQYLSALPKPHQGA